MRFPFRRLALLVATGSAAVSLFAAAAPAGPGVRLCTVGYLPDVAKIATVVGAEELKDFSVVDAASGEVVHTGDLGAVADSAPTKERTRAADFSALRRAGTYVVRVAGLPDSAPFAISPAALDRSLECVMLGFYGQRCGEAVRLSWNGETFSHAKCHAEDGWLDWGEPAKAGQRRDGTGGWHDAGDYGKYTVNAAFSTAIMLLAWEQRAETLKQFQLPALPEHGSALPDYLAELKFNLDWLLKMQLPSGEAAHKLTALRFEPMVLPERDTAKRYFTAAGRSATLNLAAVGCMAARVFRPYAAAYADTWTTVARRAWEAARAMPDGDPDTSAFKTGNYFAPTAGDYKWALIEMRLAFGEDVLTAEERTRFAQATSGAARSFAAEWDWGNGYSLGLFSWLFSAEAKKDAEAFARLRQDLLTVADAIVHASGAHAYGRGVAAYRWGGNGVVARSTMVLAAAFQLTGERRYLDAAYAQVAYLYGRNPFGRAFVTGDGFRPPQFPHHRPSAGDDVTPPWPGHLVGGANPTELDWLDETASFRTNETAINWDAALAYALAIFYRR